MAFVFDWDPEKAAENERKHAVTFAEAKSIFSDQNGLDVFDEEHSQVEDRFLRIGLSDSGRLLVAVYAGDDSGPDTFVRLISARAATRSEVSQYQSAR